MGNGLGVQVWSGETFKNIASRCQGDAQIQVLDIPNETKVGYSPIGSVRCGRSACRIAKLKWKMGKETGEIQSEAPYGKETGGN